MEYVPPLPSVLLYDLTCSISTFKSFEPRKNSGQRFETHDQEGTSLNYSGSGSGSSHVRSR